MPLEEHIGVVRKQHAQSEAKHVADTLCVKFPHILREECRDCAEDALIEWCERLDQGLIERPDHPYTWLYQSAKGHLLNARKHVRRLVGLEEITEEPAHDPEVYAQLNARDFETMLHESGITFSERVTVKIRVGLGWTWKEFESCRRDGRTANAIRKQFYTAIKKLERWAEKEKERGEGKPPLPPTSRS